MRKNIIIILALLWGLSLGVPESVSAETWTTIADGTYVDGLLSLEFDQPAFLAYHYTDNALRRRLGMPVLSLRERRVQVYEEVQSIVETLFPGGNVPPTLSAKIKAIKAANEAAEDAHALAVGVIKK
jgi:hypothetical protein